MEEIEKLKLENEELQLENTRLTGKLADNWKEDRRDWQFSEFMWTTVLALLQILIVSLFITPLITIGVYHASYGIFGKNLLLIGVAIASVYLYLFAFWFWFVRMMHVFRDEILEFARRINVVLSGAQKGARAAARREQRWKRDEL